MNFKKKRVEAKLSKYVMAKELGMDKAKYEKVEKGELELPSELIDRFLNITYNAKEIIFNRHNKLAKINEWILSGQIKKDIKDMGYETSKELAAASGMNTSDISRTINNKSVCDDVKESIYDYLQNPLNKKTETQKAKKTMVEKKEENEMEKTIVKVDSEKQIDTLKDEIKRLTEENNFLKNSIKRLFNI